ncbi:HAD-IA family hydrolase [Lachnospiraceae bacterium KK002]
MGCFRLVIFDVDGTLLNTSEGILESVRYTIKKYGLEMLEESVLKTFIGPPIQESFQRAYHLDEETVKKLTETFRDRYKSVDLLKAVPYEGIFDVFRYLKESGTRIAIATYKRQDYAEIILRHFGFGAYSDIIFGADHNNKLRKSDIIKKCLSAAQLDSSAEAVMIGDSENDATGAKEAGVQFIGVTYGFGFQNQYMEKVSALGMADEPIQLKKYL